MSILAGDTETLEAHRQRINKFFSKPEDRERLIRIVENASKHPLAAAVALIIIERAELAAQEII